MSNLFLTNSFAFAEIFGNFISKWYLYLVLILSLAIIFTVFALRKEQPRMKLSKTQTICHVSVFTALCAVVNAFTFFPASYISISLMATVCFVAGFLYGAKNAFVIGFMGDLITAIILPAGPYNPLIGLASGLMGMIPAIILKRTGNIYMKIALSTIITLIICTSGINTFGLWLVYGIGKKTFFAYLIARLPFQILVASGNAFLSAIIIRILIRIVPKNKLNPF
ncbi:MAG: ECF transporter S component [Clostridia bacterium]|nr:ECF transporter S component [Clostridia bacterium]